MGTSSRSARALRAQLEPSIACSIRLGGLTVFQALERRFQREPVYLGERRSSYGNKSRETIVRYSLEAAGF